MGLIKITCMVWLILFTGVSVSYSQGCTRTLNVGADIATAVSNAANGATICLDNGDYGRVNLANMARTGFVTLQSLNGRNAHMSPQVGKTNYVRFREMTLTGVVVNTCSKNIEFINITWKAGGGGLVFDGSTCPSTPQNYLVDNNTFDKVGKAGYDGRLSCRDCNTITIRNSTFKGIYGPDADASDGIGIAGGATKMEIGPGNLFSGILQSLCGGEHCDAIQVFGGGSMHVFGNHFENGSTFIMAPDGNSNVVVENNVFDGIGISYIDKIQFGSARNPTFRHNTLRNVRASFDSKPSKTASTNAMVENNILIYNSSWKTSSGNGCSNCTFRYNLFSHPSYASGTNNVIGMPTFTGGTSPSSYTGYQLTETSLGFQVGSDGKDMGVDFSTVTHILDTGEQGQHHLNRLYPSPVRRKPWAGVNTGVFNLSGSPVVWSSPRQNGFYLVRTYQGELKKVLVIDQ